MAKDQVEPPGPPAESHPLGPSVADIRERLREVGIEVVEGPATQETTRRQHLFLEYLGRVAELGKFPPDEPPPDMSPLCENCGARPHTCMARDRDADGRRGPWRWLCDACATPPGMVLSTTEKPLPQVEAAIPLPSKSKAPKGALQAIATRAATVGARRLRFIAGGAGLEHDGLETGDAPPEEPDRKFWSDETLKALRKLREDEAAFLATNPPMKEIERWMLETKVPRWNNLFDHIKLCEACAGQFAPHDKRDTYCSPQCGNRVRNRGRQRGVTLDDEIKAHFARCARCIAGRSCAARERLLSRDDALNRARPAEYSDDRTPAPAEGNDPD